MSKKYFLTSLIVEMIFFYIQGDKIVMVLQHLVIIYFIYTTIKMIY